MPLISAEPGPVTPQGTLVHARRRPFLIIDSGWPAVTDEVNVDYALLLPVTKSRTVCRLELMLPSRRWAGERLSDPFPTEAPPGSLVLGVPALTQGYFEGPVHVLAAESKTRIRVVLDDRPASQLIALSRDCIARLGGGFLLGFDIRRFTRA